ncbi:oxidoreductase [Arthrobacter sp. SRS-W-1-2016]|nr:oxidoreductase [Arthrobacter sp. SRS-W-1-2016]
MHTLEPTGTPIYDFSGKVALVTGASQGIGLATSKAFAQAGAAVVLLDVEQERLTGVVSDLTSDGHQALGIRCDVSNEVEVARAIDEAVTKFGRLDMAFNNAGIQIPAADAAEEPGEAFDRVTAVNLKGVWASMKHELAQMRIQGSGAIVNCSSLGGLVGNPRLASYHASKHGVIGLTSSAALEYAPRGIRINAVCPGTIVTPMMTKMVEAGDLDEEAVTSLAPIGRLGQAFEIASAVLWLCSPGASYVVGVALPVDGGYVAR